MKKLLTFIYLLLTVVLAYTQYPTIHLNRPRIYVDSTRFAWMQNNMTIAGDFKDTYNEFEYRYNNWWINDPQLYLLGGDSSLWTWNWGSQYAKDEAAFTIFMYKLNQDSLSLKRCRYLAQKVIDTLNNVDYSQMSFFEEEAFIRKFSDIGSLLVDWCYDDLPNIMLQNLVQAQYNMNREFMQTFILSNAGNSYVSSHNAWNCVYANQNALALHSAIGLSVLQQDTVQQWYEIIYDKWINGFLPCYTHYRDDDGGWNWGAAYSMWSLIDQFQLFENMRIGTDKNFYQDLAWVQNSINQYWYFIQPDNVCIHLGDGQTPLYADRVTYHHASIYQDPRSIWLSQQYSTPQYYFSTPIVFQKLLYKDFTIAPISKPNLPLQWFADKVGLSQSRSSWDSAATLVTFFNSPSKRAAHEHRDNNSFTIFKHKPLLIDAGYYDTYASSHYNNYYSRTIAHNSICVYDSAEQYSAFGQNVANDGGQIESVALQNYNDIFLPQNQRGEWVKYAVGNGYQYNIADAQLSYDSNKVSFFRRRLLHLNPNKVIVIDNVKLNNTATQQRDISWVAHFPKKPMIQGTPSQVSVPNHIETFDSNSYFVQNGKGNLAIKTILPTNTKTTRIGGDGYEFWVDGVNYPPLSLPDSNKYEVGKWRIEVKPTTQTDEVTYLHTIQIGDSLNIASAGGISIENDYNVGVDWQDTLFLFSKDGSQNNIWYQVDSLEGGRTIHIFAADLMKNCGTFVAGNIVGGNEFYGISDTNGVYQIDITLLPGKYPLVLIPCYMSVEEYANIAQVYPNPAQTILHILPLIDKPISVSVYNMMGECVIQEIAAKEIDIRTLATGMYVVKIKQGDKFYMQKFVKE